jgi:hypothetical protein
MLAAVAIVRDRDRIALLQRRSEGDFRVPEDHHVQ